MVKIGLIQTAVSDDLDANLDKTIRMIRDAAKQGAQMVCLQELFRTKYFPHDDKKDVVTLAEPIPGPTTSVLGKLAKELDIVLIVPLFERGADDKLYNSLVVFDGERMLDTYRKIHIPHDPFFYEKSYFLPGDQGYKVYTTRYGKVGALICYDQWYPEAARALALEGADIIFYPTAIGEIIDGEAWEGDWHDAWETVQRGHSIANNVHIAAVNRVGSEGKLKFWGQSFVTDAFGKVLKRGSKDKEEIVIADVDLKQNAKIQDAWGFLRNRRPDTYRKLCE
ncbi:MAG TPA: carbon-nitrogen hydrolase [Candidatus Nanoarchaeia archaeon]|nr:carbon-nitrogen hydrolase [Candidatus Nanoarchaeia archaeon]